MPVPVSARSKL